MDREAIQRALQEVDHEIIGRKKHARRKFNGWTWPDAVAGRIRRLKDQAKQYRAMLAEMQDEKAQS